MTVTVPSLYTIFTCPIVTADILIVCIIFIIRAAHLGGKMRWVNDGTDGYVATIIISVLIGILCLAATITNSIPDTTPNPIELKAQLGKWYPLYEAWSNCNDIEVKKSVSKRMIADYSQEKTEEYNLSGNGAQLLKEACGKNLNCGQFDEIWKDAGPVIGEHVKIKS